MVFLDRVVPVVVRAQVRKVFVVVNAPEPRAFLSGNVLPDALIIIITIHLRITLCLALVVLACKRSVFAAVVLAQILLIGQFFAVRCFCDSLMILCGGAA